MKNCFWYLKYSFLIPSFDQCCLSECARLALFSVMSHFCYTYQTYNKTLYDPYILLLNGMLFHTTGYMPNQFEMKLVI